jgi:Flp pilus assembly pilin Flp
MVDTALSGMWKGRQWLGSRCGATSIEYLLLAAVVGIVIITALLALSGALDEVWVWMTGEVDNAL